MKKLIVITLILLVLSAAASVYIQRTSPKKPVTPKPPVNEVRDDGWFTYTYKDIQMKMPKTWHVEEWTTSSPANGFKTEFYATKPNLSKDPSALDEPTKNLVMLEVRSKYTGMALQDIADNFKQEVGFDIQEKNYLIETGDFNKYPAVLVYKDIGSVTPEKAKYPTHILMGSAPGKVTLVTVQFFNYGSDADYSYNTIEEINKVLASVRIMNNDGTTK